jgi:proton glutamate symport protein
MAKDNLKLKNIRLSLTTQIFIGLFAGVVLGWLKPDWGVQTSFLRNIFLNLIKSIIAPLMFSTIVVGIAGGGDLKKVGRIGLKALVYFEIITTIALFAGLLVVNITKPGVGVVLQSGSGSGDLGQLAQTHPMTFIETIVHIFPTSIIDAMARGDVLQIVAFSVLFGIASSALGQKNEIIIKFCEGLSQVMFKFTGYVMKFAPFGVGAAMAATVGHKGLVVLLNLGMLVGSLYIALAIFIIFAFGSVILIFRLPLKKFIQAVREPFTLAFATTSSEAALLRH